MQEIIIALDVMGQSVKIPANAMNKEEETLLWAGMTGEGEEMVWKEKLAR